MCYDQCAKDNYNHSPIKVGATVVDNVKEK
jgi:hypothetical protein